MEKKQRNLHVNRDISWLDFNARVLQEAADRTVPLIERLRFLGIFSNNLDEFFQVRFATVKRITQSPLTGKKAFGGVTASELLEKMTKVVIELQRKSQAVFNDIEKQLAKENIIFLNEKQVSPEQEDFLNNYFIQKVAPALMTIILQDDIQDLSGNKAFLVVTIIRKEQGEDKPLYALIELDAQLERFVVLPKEGDKQYVMFLDDLIRYNFHLIFSMFKYKSIEAHMVKVTRDAAELDLEEDVGKSYIQKIMNSVKDRLIGDPVRLVYDKTISKRTLDFVMKKLGVLSTDSLIPSGRYHNRRDYMKFPSLGRKDLMYPLVRPLPIKGLRLDANIMEVISKKDFLLYTPYQNFAYVIKFLREAALDPKVRTIKITLYRLSSDSQVISSLINAAKNGKDVTVQIELQARFDESNNVIFAERLEEAGVHLIFGVPGLKVHTKICLVEREEDNKLKRYGFISTGNFNESTAKVYTDYTLFTTHQKILKDVSKVFDFFEVNYKIKKYKHLIVSPHYTKNTIYKLIDDEIDNAKQGKKAKIKLKLNNISNNEVIAKLYEASQAGVKIQMLVRGICCLVPGVEGVSDNIKVKSVVDKYLEHPRVYIFENSGFPKIYISSADFMTRNIENRVEVACPIYDESLQKQILDTFKISWKDNVKARIINGKVKNSFVQTKRHLFRSQWEIYNYFKERLEE